MEGLNKFVEAMADIGKIVEEVDFESLSEEDKKEALRVLEKLDRIDPLLPFSVYERFLWGEIFIGLIMIH